MRPATVDKGRGRGRLPITTTIWALTQRWFEIWSQLSNVPGFEVELACRRRQPRYNRRHTYIMIANKMRKHIVRQARCGTLTCVRRTVWLCYHFLATSHLPRCDALKLVGVGHHLESQHQCWPPRRTDGLR